MSDELGKTEGGAGGGRLVAEAEDMERRYPGLPGGMVASAYLAQRQVSDDLRAQLAALQEKNRAAYELQEATLADLAAAEKEGDEAQTNAAGEVESNVALRLKLDKAREERDELRAEVERLREQRKSLRAAVEAKHDDALGTAWREGWEECRETARFAVADVAHDGWTYADVDAALASIEPPPGEREEPEGDERVYWRCPSCGDGYPPENDEWGAWRLTPTGPEHACPERAHAQCGHFKADWIGEGEPVIPGFTGGVRAPRPAPPPETCSTCGGVGATCNCGLPLDGSHDHMSCGGPHPPCPSCSGSATDRSRFCHTHGKYGDCTECSAATEGDDA